MARQRPRMKDQSVMRSQNISDDNVWNVEATVEACVAFYKRKGSVTADELAMLTQSLTFLGKGEVDRLDEIVEKQKWTVTE